MKVLSLFDGISGLQQAFKNLGIEFDGKDNLYFSSEIDKYVIQVTQKNFPNTVQLGDVKNISIDDYSDDNFKILCCNGKDMFAIPDKDDRVIDLLSFGFPCQDISISKKNRQGLQGERSGLFYEALRILKEVKPKFFLAENVASMSKEVKTEITKELFGIDPILICSSKLTAQTRKRLYWVGKLQEDGTYKKIKISQPADKEIFLKDILESGDTYQDKAYALTASYNGAVFWNTLTKKQRSMVLEPICVASRGRNIVDGKRYDIKGNKTEQQLELNLNGKSNTLTTVQKDNLILQPIRLGHFNKGGQGDRIYSIEGKSVCLSANGGGRGAKSGLYRLDLPDGNYIVRKLTVNECCRLQGFPDNFCDSVSKTQGCKALGNSFTVPVIEHILKEMNFI